MAEALTAPFIMYGARHAIAGGLAFDLARTLVESVCRAVLGERSISFSADDDLPKLFKKASQSLPFLPAEATGKAEIRKSLAQTLNGLHTVIQGICELCNQCGFASHGTGTPRPAMESTQALLAAEAADAIVGFLHRVHRQDRTPPAPARTSYHDHPDFNDSVDEAHGMIRIFDVTFRPSEVLFEMEPETYRVYLSEFYAQAEGAEAGADRKGPAEVAS